MKKLLFIACMTIVGVANAATFNWSTAYEVCDGTGSESSYTSATKAYLVDSTVMSQSSLYSSAYSASTLASALDGKSLYSATMTGGKITAVTGAAYPASYTEGDVTAYMVLFDAEIGENGSLYFSEQITKQIGLVSTDFGFESASSLNAAAADMTGFIAANGGWVNVTQEVPEPTSGMLLLLGMAGLALKRKRA